MFFAAVAALANNAWKSVSLDLRTISGWRCATILMPLGWSLAAVIVHSIRMLATRVRSSDNGIASIWSIFHSETFRSIKEGKDTVLSEALFSLASFFTIVHLIYGILDLSSLVFISALEAAEVFGMYAISVLVCQMLVVPELARIRHSLCKTDITKMIPSVSRRSRKIPKEDLIRFDVTFRECTTLQIGAATSRVILVGVPSIPGVEILTC